MKEVFLFKKAPWKGRHSQNLKSKTGVLSHPFSLQPPLFLKESFQNKGTSKKYKKKTLIYSLRKNI
jgi:hypothetical protein